MRMPPWKDIIEAVWMILPRRWRATHPPPMPRAIFRSRRRVWRTVARGKSPQAGDGGGINVGEFLVFAAHAPDEAVGGGAGAVVEGPRGGENRLEVVHEEVARRLRRAHEM